MFDFTNPYADGYDNTQVVSPELQKEESGNKENIEKKIRENFLKVKKSKGQSPNEIPVEIYAKPNHDQMDNLMTLNQLFLEAMVRVQLTIIHNQQQVDSRNGFLLGVDERGNIDIRPSDEPSACIGSIKVKDKSFANWLVSNYKDDLETIWKSYVFRGNETKE